MLKDLIRIFMFPKCFNLLYVFFKFSKFLLCTSVWFFKLFIIIIVIISWRRSRLISILTSLQLQWSVHGTLFFLHVHQSLLFSLLQLQDMNSTNPLIVILLLVSTNIKIPFLFISQPLRRLWTVIVMNKLAECHTSNEQLACFKYLRNAPGAGGNVFVSELNLS